jgi:hypothetical protein
MASIFIGLNRGQEDQSPDNVVEGAGTGATDVELRIDTGKGLTRDEITRLTIRILEALNDGRSTYFTL